MPYIYIYIYNFDNEMAWKLHTWFIWPIWMSCQQILQINYYCNNDFKLLNINIEIYFEIFGLKIITWIYLYDAHLHFANFKNHKSHGLWNGHLIYVVLVKDLQLVLKYT
jgi:hypothetical protein